MKAQVNTFAQRLEIAGQQANRLYENADASQPAGLRGHLEELQDALAELWTAEQALRRQHEALLQMQQTLQKECQHYQELFDAAPDGYWVTDLRGMILQTNRTAATLLQVAPESLLRQSVVQFVSPDQRPSFWKTLNQLPSLHRLSEWELQLCRSDATGFEAALTVELVPEQVDHPRRLHWLLRDITARKQLEAQLRQTELQNLELAESDRLKSQFLGILSHELRTPMNAILGFSQLLMNRQQDPQVIRMLERIWRNGRHLLLMIEEMLDFSKLRAVGVELRAEPFDLIEVARTTVDELQTLARQKGLTFRLSSSQFCMPMVGDRTRLRQILTNLLANAIKFTESGGVSLEIEQLPEDRVAIAVRDTGIGISPTDQSHLFKEFWQSDQTLRRSYGGTGLGLAIVRMLVDAMQGTITVESQVGEGTTFYVELPLYPPCHS